MSAKYKSPSFLLPNELNTSANPANDTGINSLYSMDFDGSQYISTSSGTYFDFGGNAFSFSGWVKRTSIGDSTNVIFFIQKSGTTPTMQIRQNARNIKVDFNVGSTWSFVETTTNPIGNDTNWHHLLVTKSGTSMSIYFDGVLQDTGTAPATLDASNGTSFIGARGGNTQNWNGQIDEVAIFNRALNSTEIAALYDGTGSNIRPSNLMATNLNPIVYYPLGEQAQNTGYLDPNNPGSDMSGSEWQFPNGVFQDYVMEFDGSNKINCGTANTYNEFTLSAWIKKDSTAPNYAGIFGTRNSTAVQFPYLLSLDNTGKVRLIAGGATAILSDSAINNDTWYHVVGLGDGTNLKLYINGQLQTATATYTTQSANNDLMIGGQFDTDSSSLWVGEISNVAIWNSDQSANIANIYNNGSPQTNYTVTPQNWWKLNADSVYTPSAPNYTTALDFVASESDYIYLQDSTTNTFGFPNKTGSISAWVKIDDFSVERPIASKREIGSPGKRQWIFNIATDGKVNFYAYNTDSLSDRAVSNSTLSTGQWHHIVVTLTSTQTKIYIDGSLDEPYSNNYSSIQNDQADLNIGRRGANADIRYFNGPISNVAIYNSTLTSSQVSTLFNFGTPETNISFNPQAWWKLDNTTTGIQDSSGNGYNGTNNGTTQVNSSVAVVPSWKIPSALPITTTPNYITALDFDSSSSDYIDCGTGLGDALGTYTGNLTFSIWFKTDTVNPANDGIFYIGDFNSQGALQVNIYNNNIIFRADAGNGSKQFSFTDTTSWHNLTCVYLAGDRANSKLYLDGVLQATADGGSFPSSLSLTGLKTIIGSYYSSSFSFDGSLSNFSIWNTDLTSLQVSTLYNGGTPETAISFSPVSWWKLDTGGSTITDYGSGGNNGTNNGATQVTSDVLTPQPVNGVSTTLPSTALQQSDLQFDSPYSNYSLSFDGSTNFIDCGDSDIFSFGDGSNDSPFSLSAWVNMDDATKFRLIYKAQGASAGNIKEYLFSTGGDDKIIFYLYQDNISTTRIGKKYNGAALTSYEGQWIHLVGTYDGSSDVDGIKIYLNGIRVDDTEAVTGTYTAMQNTTLPLVIGKGGGDFANGKLDETAIFNTELTSAQVLEIYNNGRPNDLTTFSGTAPISWWRLGENAYFQDSTLVLPNSIVGAPNGEASTNNLEMISADAPGTYANGIGENLDILDRVGDAALSTSNSQSYNMIPSDISPYVPAYVGAQIANNYSMDFDGVDEYFNTGSSTIGQLQVMSVSAWFKETQNAVANTALVANNGSTNKGWCIWIDGTNMRWQVADGSSSLSWTQTVVGSFRTYAPLNQWNHVCCTFDGVYSKIYINSVLRETWTATPTPYVVDYSGNVGNLTVGRRSYANSGFFRGQIDEVAIFDTALNAGQIYNDIYQPTASAPGNNQTADLVNNPNLPNPVAWYRMGD